MLPKKMKPKICEFKVKNKKIEMRLRCKKQTVGDIDMLQKLLHLLYQ